MSVKSSIKTTANGKRMVELDFSDFVADDQAIVGCECSTSGVILFEASSSNRVATILGKSSVHLFWFPDRITLTMDDGSTQKFVWEGRSANISADLERRNYKKLCNGNIKDFDWIDPNDYTPSYTPVEK